MIDPPVFKNSAFYAGAIVSLEKALEDAKALGDYHYSGLIYRNIGDIFNASNNYSASVESLMRSVECFRLCNEPLYLDYAKVSLATAFLNNHSFNSAISTINEIRDSCDVPDIL